MPKHLFLTKFLKSIVVMASTSYALMDAPTSSTNSTLEPIAESPSPRPQFGGGGTQMRRRRKTSGNNQNAAFIDSQLSISWPPLGGQSPPITWTNASLASSDTTSPPEAPQTTSSASELNPEDQNLNQNRCQNPESCRPPDSLAIDVPNSSPQASFPRVRTANPIVERIKDQGLPHLSSEESSPRARTATATANPIVAMIKGQGLGKHAVNLVWALIIQILTNESVDPHSGSIHQTGLALALVILLLLVGFVVTWNGILFRGYLREATAVTVEQVGMSIIYLTLMGYVALHMCHHWFKLLALGLISVFIVLPFVFAISHNLKEKARQP